MSKKATNKKPSNITHKPSPPPRPPRPVICTQSNEKIVTVCAACLRASCAQEVFLCEKACSINRPKFTTKTTEELRALDRENPSFWRI